MALAIFTAVVLALLGVFWPRIGLVPRWRNVRRRTARSHREDALKQIYHATADGTHADAERLAGALEVPRDRALTILTDLQSRGLVVPAGLGVRLSDAGRREALRILRAHRLLESYLADRTGVRPEEWHDLAEEREHLLTADEVETLASDIGQPRFDPHGDPIPTAFGELPESAGVALYSMSVGDGGTISHLEDEPREAFEQLRKTGLELGKLIVLRSVAVSSLEIELDGRVVTLPRVLAPAVTVMPRAARTTVAPRTLADLAPGERGRVSRVSPVCRGAQRRRLLDLGIVPGTEIGFAFRSASGDPVAYRVRGALIALRRAQATWIELESPSQNATREA